MRRGNGFTLVELLVVIGIIALLVGILLPALGKARQSANKAACLANLHSLGIAINMYTAQYKGTLPEGQDKQNVVTWVGLLLYQMGQGNGNSTSAGTQDMNKTRGVFLCKDAVSWDPMPRTNYACHPLLMPELDRTNPPGFPVVAMRGQTRRPYNVARIRNAQEIVLVFDCTLELTTGTPYNTALNLDNNRLANTGATDPGVTYLISGFNNIDASQSIDGGLNQDSPKAFADPATDTTRRWANIRWRHSGNTMANFLFVDGHADSRRYKSRFQTELLRKNINVPPAL